MTETPTQRYYKKNQSKLKERASETILCDVCQLYIARAHKSCHNKSKRHIMNLTKSLDDKKRKELICKYTDENVIKCDCGSYVGKLYIDRHNLTKKHIFNMYNKNLED
jgi:hypothetical protein